jgi:hypothetical protein
MRDTHQGGLVKNTPMSKSVGQMKKYLRKPNKFEKSRLHDIEIANEALLRRMVTIVGVSKLALSLIM